MTVKLGSEYINQKQGAKRYLTEKFHTFQYIPLIDNLEWMLQNKDLHDEVCAITTYLVFRLQPHVYGSDFKSLLGI